LQPRRAGGWLAVGPDAFELIGDVAAANPAPAPTPTPAPRGSGSILDALGISAEELKIQGHYALRVSALERNGAGKQAGLEVGDVIIGANNQPLSSLADLSKLAKPGEELQLVVVDVNSGKPAQVAVAVPATVASNAPRTTNAPRPAPPAAAPGAARRSLGLSAEPVSLGQRTALKVVAVEPESPAAKAGLEPGDVIVEANDIPITGVEQLAAALRKSGSVLNLTVRNVRNNQDTLVPVQLGGATLAPVPPDLADDVPAPTRAGSATGGLGAVTELTFYDIEAAVKVTEVEPGSPALRAGIEVGDIIVEANGKPVLHPNDLTEIVRQSGSTLKLTVVDPRKGQKTPVDVNLGGR
jgi:S1-C subfamily serine protease